MYLVVEFLEQRELSIVPAGWTSTDTERGFCTRWPSHMFPLTLKRAVTKMVSPDPCWPVYSIRVLYSTGSYRKAAEILEVLDLYTDPELKGISVNLETKCQKRSYSSGMPESLGDVGSSTNTASSSCLVSGPMSMACLLSRPGSSRRYLPSPPNVNDEAPPRRMLPSPVNFVKIQPDSIDTSQSQTTSTDSVQPKRIISPVQMMTKLQPDVLRSMTCPKTTYQTHAHSTTRPKSFIRNDTTDSLSGRPLMGVISQLKTTLQEQTRLMSDLAEIVKEPQLTTFTSNMISSQGFQESLLRQTIPKRVTSDWHGEQGTNDDHYRA